MDTYRQNQRCQFPFQEKKGLEELNAFTGMVFNKGLEPNIVKLDGIVKQSDVSAWLCGFAPGMKAAVAASHHGSQFRYLAGGSIQFLAFLLGSVLDSAVAASQQSGHSRTHLNISMKDVHGHISKMGHDDLLEIA